MILQNLKMLPLHQRITKVLQPPMHGWCTPEKGIELADLILEYKPKNALEIGIFGGRSLFAMAMAMQQLGRVATGIDPWVKAATLVGQDDINARWWSEIDIEAVYRQFVHNVHELSLLDACQWIRGDSQNVVNLIADESIEFFHLDSNHSEFVSCRDVDAWTPKLAKKAIWVMDDTDWHTQSAAIGMIQDAGFALKNDREKYMIFER